MTGTRTPAAVILAKAPVAGRVKTRLEPLLGPAGCARLQAALLTTVTQLTHTAGLDTWVAVDPPEAIPAVSDLVPPGSRLLGQHGRGLGERIAHAVDAAFAPGLGATVVVGTDAPTLTATRLRQAIGALADHDVVLGPAYDGGYYLIALSRPAPDLFALPAGAWGGPHVLAQTLQIADEHGLSVQQLPPMRDLDTPDDAAALRADPLLPPAIAAQLAGPMVGA